MMIASTIPAVGGTIVSVIAGASEPKGRYWSGTGHGRSTVPLLSALAPQAASNIAAVNVKLILASTSGFIYPYIAIGYYMIQ
jgi:hypothetical protein